jgi:hypothetical protein
MAKLGWLGSVGLAIGAGAGAAAAQFGLGYGFAVIAWSPSAGTTVTSDRIWLTSLAWTLWIAATSTVIGAVAADRRSAGEIGAAPPRGAERAQPSVMATAIWRALLSVAASVGALLSVALVLPPAHNATRADTTSPHLIAAGYAIVGIVIGIVLAVCALSARAAALNVVIISIWLWLLAAASVVVGVARGKGYGTAVLEGWPLGDSSYFWHNFSIDLTVLMLGTALIVGVASAWPATRRQENRVGVVLSGGAGPLLVAAAYVLTAPALVGISGNTQASTSVIALCAVIAGLAGSGLLVAAIAAREASKRERRSRADEDLDIAQLRRPSPIGASVPGSLGAVGAGPAGPPTVPSKAAPKVPASRAKAAAAAPAPREASEQTTARIPTSPRRDGDPRSDGTSPGSKQSGLSTPPMNDGPTPPGSGSVGSGSSSGAALSEAATARRSGPSNASGKRGRRR